MLNDAARTRNTDRLYDLLEENDLPGLEALFRSFFASIPYEWYTNNDIANFEGYYASVFYSHFAALGLDVAVEESANRERLDSRGRLDMAVRFEDRVYIFEFKVVEQAREGSAMAQLKDRGYAEKYRAPDVDVHLIGVEFSSASRNVVAFEHAAA